MGALLTLLLFRNTLSRERIDLALAFVGGVMMAVAALELLPEALRMRQLRMTGCGFVAGVVVMSLSLYLLD